jgi:hypothetical protein
MIRRAFMVGAVSAVALMLSADSFVQQSQTGTAQEAQAMLTKTVAAMKADKTNTIAMINKGEGGFLQGDIYPFCFQISDGKVVATAPQLQKFIGTDIRTLKDPTGKVFGPELFVGRKRVKSLRLAATNFQSRAPTRQFPK